MVDDYAVRFICLVPGKLNDQGRDRLDTARFRGTSSRRTTTWQSGTGSSATLAAVATRFASTPSSGPAVSTAEGSES
jgi:hypothetical protein